MWPEVVINTTVWVHNIIIQVKQIHIDYARNAKRLDVKKLKTKMWEIITQNEEDMKENMVDDFVYMYALYYT